MSNESIASVTHEPGSFEHSYQPKTAFTRWLDARLPVIRFTAHFMAMPTPRNIKYVWAFGAILAFFLVVQLYSGIILAMHYAPNSALAFESIEKLMRDTNYGWLMRYTHMVGASLFFFAAFIHLFRGLYFGSYKSPREILWMIGVAILLCMMATAFMGYSLVWGQMSFWAVTVITNLFSSLDSIYPGLGTAVVEWIWGGFSVGNPTLNRLFSLHYMVPFVLVALVALHIWALHVVGSNNPTGIEVKDVKKETLPFHPYFTTKDMYAIALIAILFAYFVFWVPNYLGDVVNYEEANPLKTPPHIVPEWYFLPFYAILRAIPSKLGGVIAMFGAIVVLFFIPWLDTSRVRSIRYRPIFRWFFWAFVFDCIALGYIGALPAAGAAIFWGRVFTVYYFAFFLLIMPLVGLIEKPSAMPESIEEDMERKAKPSKVQPVPAE